MNLTIAAAILLTILVSSSCELCPENEYFQSIEIISPLNGSEVERFTYIKVIATVYNVDVVMNVKQKISLCHNVDEIAEHCDLNVFDEHLLDLQSQGLKKIRVSICMSGICFCNSTSYVEYREQKEDSNQTLFEISKIEDSIADGIINWSKTIQANGNQNHIQKNNQFYTMGDATSTIGFSGIFDYM